MMDDDVKNLFQKFGQSTSAYREVNRELDSEQARQRWPLLRDIRVSEVPAHFSHDADAQSNAPDTIPEVGIDTLKTASPFLKNQPPIPASSEAKVLVATAPVAASVSTTVGAARANEQPHPSVVPLTDNQVTSPLFKEASRNDVVGIATGAFAAQPVSPTTHQPMNLTEQAPVLAPQGVSVSTKSQSVTDVFKRLVDQKKPQAESESPVNSFFKKIFRS